MLEILMNGVFAFAMTLIVKNNIPLPTAAEADDFVEVIEYLMKVFFDAFHFFFTFIILAALYILAFEIMRNLRRVDRTFVYLTLLFLLSIVFIPLTSLLMSYSDVLVPYGLMFHANIIFCGMILLVQWKHASERPSLTRQGITERFTKRYYLRVMVFPITAVAGMFLDLGNLSQGNFLYVFPVIAFILLSGRE